MGSRTPTESSFVLYGLAQHSDGTFPLTPRGEWYFNPFAWQFLFVLGAWFAVGGANQFAGLLLSHVPVAAAAVFLVFALVISVAGWFPAADWMIPGWIGAVTDKSSLGRLRLVHFAALALLVVRNLPRDWLEVALALAAYHLRPAVT